MANSTVKTVSTKVITLELSEDEATLVRAVLGKVSGQPGVYRDASAEVFRALNKAGVSNWHDNGWDTKVSFSSDSTVRVLN